MRIRVEKCAGGVALVLPESLAAQAGLSVGTSANLELAGGQLVLRPCGLDTLADILARITPENLHAEWASGAPAGAELL
ncbi:AbrB/MazE/SpoVT family DNA-binding domain-containing protein [soil metagenome]